MRTPQEISLFLYNLLKVRPYSIRELHQALVFKGVHLSKRSVYRYLNKLETSLENTSEIFEVESLENNKRCFSIRSVSAAQTISDDDWIMFINNLVLFYSNAEISDSTAYLNERMLEFVLGNAPLKSLLLSLVQQPHSLYQSSRFGEIQFDHRLKNNLYKFIYFFSKRECVKIDRYTPIVVKNLMIPQLGEALIPVKIIYHRCNYAFCFYSSLSNKLFSIELDMIEKISPTKQVFSESDLKDALNHFPNQTFGYHQALLPGEFEVTLLFAANPGGHVTNRFWHPTQKFEWLPDGEVKMTLSCEINIELIGWIAMWLDNVKVLGPPELIDLLKTRFMQMQELLNPSVMPTNNS